MSIFKKIAGNVGGQLGGGWLGKLIGGGGGGKALAGAMAPAAGAMGDPTTTASAAPAPDDFGDEIVVTGSPMPEPTFSSQTPPHSTGMEWTGQAPANIGALAADAPSNLKKGNGIFDRIGDFINSDEGRGALLRSGAATMQGGLGAGIAAGAGWMDQRRMEKAKQGQWEAEHAQNKRKVDIDQQQANQTGMYQQGQLGNATTKLKMDAVRMAHIRDKELRDMDLSEEELAFKRQAHRDDVALGYRRDSTQRRGQDVQRETHYAPSGSTQYTVDAQNERWAAEQESENGAWNDVDLDTGDGVKVSGRYPRPTMQSITVARQNPSMQAAFDLQYGPGSYNRLVGAK
jgi:hypothetical protein